VSFKTTESDAVLSIFTLMPISHRSCRQGKTVLSCLCWHYELNWQQDKTVNPVSNLQLFSLPVANWKRWQDKTKLSCLVASLDHTADTDKTRQDSFVLSVSAVWNRHKADDTQAFCCATCCTAKLRTLQPRQIELQQNAQSLDVMSYNKAHYASPQ